MPGCARSFGRWFAGGMGVLASSWSSSANAAPFELAWSAPEGCPSREQIVEATRAHLGERPSDSLPDRPPELFVRGEVTAKRGGFLVRLALRDASEQSLGERVVHVDERRCSAIEEPTSVVLAMMIAVARPAVPERAEAAPSDAAESRGPGPEPASPPPSAPISAPARTPPPRGRRVTAALAPALPLRVLGSVAATGSVGTLPTAGLGFALRAMIAPRVPLVFGLETSFEASSSVRVGDAEIGFQLFGLAARVGLAGLRAGPLELIPTAGVRGALLRTSPTGFRATENETRATVLAGPGALARLPLGSNLFVEVLPEVSVVLVRDELQVLHAGKLYSVHRPSLFEGRLSLGIGYEFR